MKFGLQKLILLVVAAAIAAGATGNGSIVGFCVAMFIIPVAVGVLSLPNNTEHNDRAIIVMKLATIASPTIYLMAASVLEPVIFNYASRPIPNLVDAFLTSALYGVVAGIISIPINLGSFALTGYAIGLVRKKTNQSQ